MNDHHRLDLSALDPARDPAHWERVVDATLLCVDAALSRPAQDPLSLIASWARPLLAATAVALAVLVPVEVALEARETRVEQVRRLVALSAAWARGEPPSGTEFLQALADGPRP